MRRKSFTNRLLAVVLASAMLISTIAPSKAYASDALVQAENSDAGSSAKAAVQEDDKLETAVQTDNSKQKKSVDAAPSDGTSDTNVEEDAEDYSVTVTRKNATLTITKDSTIQSIGTVEVPVGRDVGFSYTDGIAIVDSEGNDLSDSLTVTAQYTAAEIAAMTTATTFTVVFGYTDANGDAGSFTMTINAVKDMIAVTGEDETGIQYQFDKDFYKPGETVTAKLTAPEGFGVKAKSLKLLDPEGEEIEFEGEYTLEDDGSLTFTFPAPDKDTEVSAETAELRNLTFKFQDAERKDVAEADAPVTGTASPKFLYDGVAVTVTVTDNGNTWGVIVTTGNGEDASDYIDREINGNTVTFVMPDADVTVTLYQKEGGSVVDPDLDDGSTDISGNVDENIAALGSGTEPTVALGKSAVWTDIENGLADLTITEKDTDKQTNIPTNYLIVLDKTRTMSLNEATFEYDGDTYYSSQAATSAGYSITNSPCLNPNHEYAYRGIKIRYVDYQNAYFVSGGGLGGWFNPEDVGCDQHWKYHSCSPLYKNGCTDRLSVSKDVLISLVEKVKQQMNELNDPENMSTFTYWGFADDNSLHDTNNPSSVGTYADGIYHFIEKSTNYDQVIEKIKHTGTRSGTYYLPSFELAEKLIRNWKNQGDKSFTKFVFISDGVEDAKEYHLGSNFHNAVSNGPAATRAVADRIKAMDSSTSGRVKIYTICIGFQSGTEAANIMQNLASPGCAAALFKSLVTGAQSSLADTIAAMDKEGDLVTTKNKTITDYISKYYELEGIQGIKITDKNGSVTNFSKAQATVQENGDNISWTISYNGGNYTLSIDKATDKIVWNVPDGASTTYAATFQIKLKDEYRYLLSDTTYPTNADAESKGAAKISYKISGGPYNGQTRSGEVKTPNLKYGTVNFDGEKIWTVSDSFVDMTVNLTRILPDAAGNYPEASKRTINFQHLYAAEQKWSYEFKVRKLAAKDEYGEDTKPLIKYDNAGRLVKYDVVESDIPNYTEYDKIVSTNANGVTTTKFYNEPYKIKAQITKIDEETKNPLSGAEFTVYQWSEKAGNYVEYKGETYPNTKPYETGLVGGKTTMTLTETGTKGVYITPAWLYYTTDNQGRYRIVETCAPSGYYGDWKNDASVTPDSDPYADKNVYDFNILDHVTKDDETGKTITISNNADGKFDDQRVLGRLTYLKNDKEAKEPTAQGDATLAGATYRLYAAEDIIHQDQSGTVLYKAGEEIHLEAAGIDEKTGANLYIYRDKAEAEDYPVMVTNDTAMVVVKELEIGKYYLKEESASEGYLVDPNSYYFEVKYEGENIAETQVKMDDGDTTYDVFEQVMKQSMDFYKISDNDNDTTSNPLAGAGFTAYLVSDLAGGKFKDLSDEELPQAILDYYRNVTTLTYEDMAASCKPAVVYAEADDPDVVDGKLVKSITYTHQDGSKVTVSLEDFGIVNENAYFANEMFSNNRGVVTTPDLPYGRYVIVETTTPEDFITAGVFVMNVQHDDEDGTVDGDGKGQKLDQIQIERDEEINAYIRIVKTDSQSGKAVLKPGVKYLILDTDGAWLKYYSTNKTTAEINKYKKDHAYYDEDGNLLGYLVVQYSQGEYCGTPDNPWTTKEVSNTAENGSIYIETTEPLPGGEYELIELNAPEGYIAAGHEGVIAKSEDETSAKNNTYYENTDTTGENEQWEKRPQGNTHFRVTSSAAKYEAAVGAYVVTVKQKNDPAIGKISIYKEGEYLDSAKQEGQSFGQRINKVLENALSLFQNLFGAEPAEQKMTEDELNSFINYQYHYEKHPIAGAKFEIRAAEDIYSQEGGENSTKLFDAGELVCTLTTDEDGKAWTGDKDWDGSDVPMGLPLGTYTVTEISPGYGFALSEENKQPRTIEISYAGEEVPVIYQATAYENPRQKVALEITKTDRESGEKLADAVFGLYTSEDLKNYDGKIVIPADTLVAVTKTTAAEDGSIQNAVFEEDLPLGKYYVKELQAPKGYATNQEKFDVDATWREDGRKVIELYVEVSNVLTSVQINLMDYNTEVELSGAVFAVLDKDGKAVAFVEHRDGEIKVVYTGTGTSESFTTERNNNVIIRGLEVDNWYTLSELTNAEGYGWELFLKDGYESTYAQADPDHVVDAAVKATEKKTTIQFYVDDVEERQIVSVFVKPGKGDIAITKTGEVPTGTEETEDGTLAPVYEVKGLPNTEYALVADGQIDYPDKVSGTLLKDKALILEAYAAAADDSLLKKYYDIKAEQGTLLDVSGYVGTKYPADATQEEINAFYAEHKNEVERQIPSEEEAKSGKFTYSGTPVGLVIVTDENGIAKISGLPLAHYRAVEVAAPDGYTRDLKESVKTVDLNGVKPDDDLNIVAEVTYTNARQYVPETPDSPQNGTVKYTSSILITKEASGHSFKAGDTVMYTMVLTNNGETTLKDVTVEDSLGGTFVGATSTDIDAGTITFDGATAKIGCELAPGNTVTFSYQYTIPADTAVGTVINNTVKAVGAPIPYNRNEDGTPKLSWTDEDGTTWTDITDYQDVTDDATEKVKVTDNVDIIKDADAVEYRPGETAHYTIYAVNNEDQDLHDVNVVDSLGGTFELASAEDDVIINEDGTATIKTFPAHSIVTLKYAYKVPENSKEMTIPNTVTLEVHGSTVESHPGISIKKYAEQSVYKAGETATYQMIVTNTGNMALKDVKVVDSLKGTFVGAASDTMDTTGFVMDGNAITIGKMPAGAVVTLTYEYVVPEDAAAGDEILNTAKVTGTSIPKSGEEPTPVEDEDNEKITVPGEKEQIPDINLIKSVNKHVVLPGEKVIYTLTVINTGTTALTNVTLKDTLLNLGSLADLGDLAVGKTKTVTYEYTVPTDATAGSNIPNVATVVGTEVLPDDSTDTPRQVEDKDDESIYVREPDKDNPSDDEIIIVRKPEITVTKVADKELYAPGETVHYTIQVENTGIDDLTDVVLNEILLTGGTYTATSKGKIDGTQVQIGDLAVGEIVTINYEYVIPQDAVSGTRYDNIVTVSGKTVPVVNPQNPTNPDGTPNYLPEIPVSDSDEEQVWTLKKGTGLSIVKKGVDDGTEYPLAGAEYTLYADEDVTNIFGTVIYKAGTKIETAVSGKDGVAAFKADLPIGRYRIEETKAPAGHYSTSKVVTVGFDDWKYNDQWQTLDFTEVYENAITQVKVYLKDDMTYKELAGASLNVMDPDGNTVEAWLTRVEDGYLIKGLNTDTEYTIVETIPRNGYLVNYTGEEIVSENAEILNVKDNTLKFIIHDVETGLTEDGSIDKSTIPVVTEITLLNKFVTGNIILNKDGELLDSWTLVDKLGDLVKSIFGYNKKPLEGVTFAVYAEEDIYHPDGVSGLLYHKGDLVATDVRGLSKAAVDVTGADGVVQFEGMFLGAYSVKEQDTKDGYKILEEPLKASLVYVDAYTDPVSAVEGTLTAFNETQKAVMTLTKLDSESKKPLQGAVFGLYAGEDIKSAAGNVIVKKDTLLETSKSGEDGKAVFETLLPLGSYYTKETTAPDGYKLTDEALSFTVKSDKKVGIHKFEGTVYNTKLPKSGGHGGSDSNPKTPVSSKDTKTGDVALGALIAAVALAAAGIIVVCVKRKKAGKKKDGAEKEEL